MNEEQEKAKKWLRELHPDVRDSLIRRCINMKKDEEGNELEVLSQEKRRNELK